MARSKTVELINTSITITSGEAVSISLLTGPWHEALVPIVVSGVDSSHAVDIEISADGTIFVPAKDLSDNVLSNITGPGVFIISGKMNFIKVHADTMTDNTVNPIVQIVRSE